MQALAYWKIVTADKAGFPTRRPSKRQKDLADIARLVEAHPRLRERVPSDVLERLIEPRRDSALSVDEHPGRVARHCGRSLRHPWCDAEGASRLSFEHSRGRWRTTAGGG